MKTLELQLQKRLLIVELDRNTTFSEEANIEAFIDADKWLNSLLKNNRDLKLICKGSELTEGITKQLVHAEDVSDVEDYRHEKIFTDYNDDENAFRCGFESFISAIENAGYYWGENPIKEPIENDYNLGDIHSGFFHKKYNEWKEAESRTFNPEKTLIFEILEK